MQSTSTSWTPDESLFEKVNGELRGVLRVKEALKAAGLNTDKPITSLHPSVLAIREKLRTDVVPSGFEQHQLPVLLPGENAMYFITIGQPNAKFPPHRHTKDDGLRVIISGSITYEGAELIAGDWMYVPRGCSYSFEAGASGCAIFHAYGPSE